MNSKTSPKFEFQITKVGREVTVTLSQPIDGPFEIPSALMDGAEKLYLDLEAVGGINSEGTRQFTRWLWEIHVAHPELKIRLRHVNPVVARQLVPMKSYIDEAVETESLYAPFFCEACDEEDRGVLVRAGEVRAAADLARFSPPPPLCRTCGKPMELDVLPDKYFALLMPPE